MFPHFAYRILPGPETDRAVNQEGPVNPRTRAPGEIVGPWSHVAAKMEARNPPAPPHRDRLQFARYCQSLMDSREFKNRATFARFLGISRARVK